jgi:hypothetical protein
MWMLAHQEELAKLPEDEPFLYNEVGISFSIFRQAVDRGILRSVDTTDTGNNVWSLKEEVPKEKQN